jgi:hypothetical protein
MLPAGQLRPNDYNPNRMTDAEFAELVTKVRHLGRLPKPVIVLRSPGQDGYVIVDGEHGWRAARGAGLAEVPCEVIDADDFEAMRQTYRRNQHGSHNPVLLGQMFRRMMAGRGLSARALAREIAVSEGTVRNAVLYAEAHDLRNGYAPNEIAVVEDLSVRQVRCYMGLPPRVAQLWLDSGGDVKTLLGTKDESGADEASGPGVLEAYLEDYRRLDETGLFEFAGRVWNASGFACAVREVRRWDAWERGWRRYGIPRDTLRGYSRHLFQKKFHVREESMMDSAIGEVLDQSTRPPTFLLSAEEFDAVLERTSREPESHDDFMQRLALAVAGKTGEVRQNMRSVKRELLEKQLGGAPDYIRESPLNDEAKYALWQAEESDLAKREIAQLRRLPLEGAEDDAACAERLIRTWESRRGMQQQVRAALEGKTEQELAQEMARRFVIYDQEKDADAIAALAGKLASLTKPELVFLVEYAKWMEYQEALAKLIGALA